MKLRKSHLRECGRFALEQRGFRVEAVSGQGILPGARLLTIEGSEQRKFAVRTSLDREVGLTRHPDGRWMTIPNVDEVVIVVPSAEDPGSAEVLGFDPEVLIRVFDEVLAGRKKRSPDISYKAPIFVALDKRSHSGAGAASGLKEKAQWQALVPYASVRSPDRSKAGLGFIERVKREFAELIGVDVSKVVVEFRIVG